MPDNQELKELRKTWHLYADAGDYDANCVNYVNYLEKELASKESPSKELEEQKGGDLRCPFCNYIGQFSPRPTQYEGGNWQLHCGACGAGSPVKNTKAGAYDSWNTRAPSKQLTATQQALAARNEMLTILGGIFYYGDFKVETSAEAELKELMVRHGFFYTNENDFIAAKAALASIKE